MEHPTETGENRELRAELKAAHQIIRNALNIMTASQKAEWSKANDRDGVSGEGITRANEREKLIAKFDRHGGV